MDVLNRQYLTSFSLQYTFYGWKKYSRGQKYESMGQKYDDSGSIKILPLKHHILEWIWKNIPRPPFLKILDSPQTTHILILLSQLLTELIKNVEHEESWPLANFENMSK